MAIIIIMTISIISITIIIDYEHLVNHLLSFSRSKSLCQVTNWNQSIDGDHESEKDTSYDVGDNVDNNVDDVGDGAQLYWQIT